MRDINIWHPVGSRGALCARLRTGQSLDRSKIVGWILKETAKSPKLDCAEVGAGGLTMDKHNTGVREEKVQRYACSRYVFEL